MLNRGKRSVMLDPRREEDRARARQIADSADIVIENHGDAMARTYGFDYTDIAAQRPELIWCSVSGMGRGAGGRAIDMTLQASMGMSALTGEESGPPLRGAMPFVDLVTGMYASQLVLAARLQVERGGSGALLDCAMVDAAAALTATPAALALGRFSKPRRMGSESDLFVPSKVFQAADGNYVHIVALSGSHWKALCRAIGQEQWLSDERFATNNTRLQHREYLHASIADAILTKPAEHWCTQITADGGFCARVREVEEAWNDRVLRTRGRLIDIEGLDFAVPVATLTGQVGAATRGPFLGEHNEALA
ncbi:hypothetical protein A5630_11565 [Mycolicibacterium mucogenicum]|uniref:CoA transferase n=2 Tax=Mycolicibacterium mucogenicum TaxID=56689 RepID=A0A1A3HFT6_MYCMU|nr:hypothetical protein A5630_11565 [Mycolicibacterium mucogenicum]